MVKWIEIIPCVHRAEERAHELTYREGGNTRKLKKGKQRMNQKLLELIKERANGITVPEVLAKTELDYNGILTAVEELCANGHQIGIITVGRTAYRLYQAE